MDVISKNPVKYAIKPSYDTLERRAYFVTQMWQLLDKADGKLKTFLYIAFLTGMRAGEILALNWGDIDFNKKIIIVSKTKTQYGIGKTKSRKDRKIPLMNKLYEYLFSLDKNGENLLDWHYTGAQRGFRELCVELKFFYEGLHNTRHTFASLMLQARENPLLVKEFLGHANLTMINTVYAHYIRDNEDCSRFGTLLEHRA